MKKHLAIGLSTLTLAAALTACGGTVGTTSNSSTPVSSSAAAAAPPSAGPSSGAADLKITTSGAGKIIVDGKGMSIYFFAKDVKDSGKSACVDACVAMWPAVTISSATPSVEGVTGAVARREPIPLYAEMSSINPAFVPPSALVDVETHAHEYVTSLTGSSGQLCTSPGCCSCLWARMATALSPRPPGHYRACRPNHADPAGKGTRQRAGPAQAAPPSLRRQAKRGGC